jgi:ferrous iron transport protein A
MTIALNDLRVGERGTICGYDPNARPLRARLLAMGLTRGTDVTVVRAAPAGDPIELHTRGYSLTVRKAEAAALHIHRAV